MALFDQNLHSCANCGAETFTVSEMWCPKCLHILDSFAGEATTKEQKRILTFIKRSRRLTKILIRYGEQLALKYGTETWPEHIEWEFMAERVDALKLLSYVS